RLARSGPSLGRARATPEAAGVSPEHPAFRQGRRGAASFADFRGGGRQAVLGLGAISDPRNFDLRAFTQSDDLRSAPVLERQAPPAPRAGAVRVSEGAPSAAADRRSGIEFAWMRAMARAGRFIVLEGIDGAGTTTQAELLSTELRREGRQVLTTGEPSDGPIGTLIRQALTETLHPPIQWGALSDDALALLFAADRLAHLRAQILPALERGQVVICDRYLLSSLAYQGSVLPVDWVEQINARAISPDLTIFLEVNAEIAAERRASRGGKAELFENPERQRKVIQQYLAAIRSR